MKFDIGGLFVDTVDQSVALILKTGTKKKKPHMLLRITYADLCDGIQQEDDWESTQAMAQAVRLERIRYYPPASKS